MYAQSPNRQHISALFGKALVVRPLMENIPLDRAQIFCPLLFQVNKRPLPPAERKVLYARELEIFILRISHPMVVTVTPSGIAAAFIVTV